MNRANSEVRAHGEKFNFDILEFRKIKNSSNNEISKKQNFNIEAEVAADSNVVEEFEVVSLENVLDTYNDDADKVDQNSRNNQSKFQALAKEEKHKIYLRKKEREKFSLIKVYLSPDYKEYARVLGSKSNRRKNASAGSGIIEIMKKFIPMSKRNELQVRRIQLLLDQLDSEENNLAVAQMKDKSSDYLATIKDKTLNLSKDVIYFMDLFGFSPNELKLELTANRQLIFEGALARVTNFNRERRLVEYHADL